MNTTKLNILIVEDKAENIAAARKMLSEHNLTVVSGFDDALTALGRNGYARHKVEAPEHFDVVLTDCMFPKGGTACMGPTGQAVVSCQGEMPYGPMVVLHAIEVGVPSIGLITKGNHHDDPFVFALDSLKGWKSDKVSVVITNRNLFGQTVHKETYEKVVWSPAEDSDYAKLEKAGMLVQVKDWRLLFERVTGLTVPADDLQKRELERRQI